MSKQPLVILFAASLTVAAARAAGPVPDPVPAEPSPAPAATEARADQRFNEMLDRMQAAVEEIAGLYGNPTFLQVFTNDPSRAEELKLRLRTDQGVAHLGSELKDLERRRDAVLNDIALKERESARLAARLVRQRAALDMLATAVDEARKAVEDTSR